MDIMSLAKCVPIIVICFAIGLGCKAWKKLPDKWIPFILAVIGGGIGAVALKVVPNFPATDYITAISVGVVSGLSATGVHQAYKQTKKTE